MAGVTLGALQVGGGGPDQSPWYRYGSRTWGQSAFSRTVITWDRCFWSRSPSPWHSSHDVRGPAAQQFRDALGCAGRGRVPDDCGRRRPEPFPCRSWAVHSGGLRVHPAAAAGLQAQAPDRSRGGCCRGDLPCCADRQWIARRACGRRHELLRDASRTCGGIRCA